MMLNDNNKIFKEKRKNINKLYKKKKQNNELIYWFKKWLHVSSMESHKTTWRLNF